MTAAQAFFPLDPVAGAVRRRATLARWAGALIASLVVIGLFGRVMSFPLNHDEQIHVAAARLFLHAPLYQGLGYNHLPGLPILLGGVYALSGTDHLLLAGRLLIFLCWIATAGMLWLIARRCAGDARLGLVSMLLLAGGTLLGPAGMLTTNNFLPIPFALLAVHLFVTGLDGPLVRPWRVFAAGLAIGWAVMLKVSYVFLVPPVAVAGLMVPRGLPLAARLRLVLLPLLAGGLIGGLPVLVVLAVDPQGFIAHTIRYFTAGHLTYWRLAAGPKAMSFAEKGLVAEDVWLARSGLLVLVLTATSLAMLARRNGRELLWWPLPLTAALAVLAAIGALAPTPAFPQYYEPPLPMLILVMLLAYRRMDMDARGWFRPLTTVAGVLALAIILLRVVPGIPAAFQPSRWTGNILHAQGRQIGAALAERHVSGKVATVAPIVALEGGLPIYRAFAAGPFLYRVADYLPAGDRRYFTTTSPEQLPRFLDNDPPAAIVTGWEPEFDPAFIAYAAARGYRPVALGNGQARLFVRP